MLDRIILFDEPAPTGPGVGRAALRVDAVRRPAVARTR
jgi:hypothetical protein